jgi:hypothetical protein
LASAILAHRSRELQAELSDSAAAAERLRAPPQRRRQLLAVTRGLRDAEGGLAFHARLAREVAAAAAGGAAAGRADGSGRSRGDLGDRLEYTESNFSYASTPFWSWAGVMAQAPVAAALDRIRGREQTGSFHLGWPGQQQQQQQQHEPVFMVWGSSAGWLVFYARLGLGWPRCVGVELLPCLVEAANGAAAVNGVDGVAFECGDLQASSLAGVMVLQLTEQCWDEELLVKVRGRFTACLPPWCQPHTAMHPPPTHPTNPCPPAPDKKQPQAAAKIDAELAPSALVVGYTGGVVGRLARGRRLAGPCPLATSWGVVRMHVYVMGA